jgi:predicted transcriptional regulator
VPLTDGDGGGDTAPEVAADTPVRAVMERLMAVPAVTVTDAGLPVGRITQPSVLHRLLKPKG